VNRKEFLQRASSLGIASLAGYSLFIENNLIEITHHKLVEPHYPTHLRIVQISDLHMGGMATNYKKVAEMLHQIAPDFILITGDTFDSRNDVKAFNEFMSDYPKHIPTFASIGNWDIQSDLGVDRVIGILSQNGITVLRNKHQHISLPNNYSMNLIGVDDSREGNPRLMKAVKNMPKATINIIMHHCPVEFRRVKFLRKKFPNKVPYPDLCLAGHTHGGQINLFGFRPILPVGSGGYAAGWYYEGKCNLYVNRGIGTTKFPFRLMSRPEIAVFEFSNKA